MRGGQIINVNKIKEEGEGDNKDREGDNQPGILEPEQPEKRGQVIGKGVGFGALIIEEGNGTVEAIIAAVGGGKVETIVAGGVAVNSEGR